MTAKTAGACGEQSDRRPEPGPTAESIHRRRDIELSPEDDAEDPDLWILQEDLHVPQDRSGCEREHSFHVDRRREYP